MTTGFSFTWVDASGGMFLPTTTSTANVGWNIDPDAPYREGFGPAEFSTCTTLALRVYEAADPNGYYRALGVHWRAGKKELREAYQALDGQSSAYLTYVLHQLLDSEFRARYDLLRVGEMLIDDYILEYFRRTVRINASPEKLQEIFDFEEQVLSADQPDPEALKSLQESLDDPASDVHDEMASPDTGYHFSHYVLRSTSGDKTLLPEWQSLLIQACRNLEIEVSLSLGFHAKDYQPWFVRQVGLITVVFFHELLLPDSRYATDAATEIHRTQQEHRNGNSRKDRGAVRPRFDEHRRFLW